MCRRVIALLLMAIYIMLPINAFAEINFSSNPDAIEQAAKSVLMLQVFDADNNEIATGSGFVAFNNRTIVTNQHVIEGADWILANSDDGYEYMVTKVLVADEEKDIAICSFMSPTDLQPLEFNLDRELKRAENVVAIGSPKGFTNIVSLGNISAIYRDEALLQFTAPISHGSSGGALFDDSGRVIGITSGGFDDAQNLNFAIHISEVESLYNSWDGVQSSFKDYMEKSLPTPEPTPISYRVLSLGDYGQEVTRLQKELIRLGYLTNAPEGRYESKTKQAVLLFNIQNLGRAVSVADGKMQRLLFGGNPKPYDPSISPKSTPTPKPTRKPSSYKTLQKGDSGEAVRRLQTKLIQLGYLNGTADGIFGVQTENAVLAFNKQNSTIKSKKAYGWMQELLFEGNPKPYRK